MNSSDSKSNGPRLKTDSATQVLLIRHGQSEGNAERRFGGHTATPLSPRGLRQAQVTARTLAAEAITAIYSSDLLRAIQTAEPLAELTGLASALD